MLYAIPNNKSNASPGTVVFFDTEAFYDPTTAYETGQFQRLRLGCAIVGRLEGGRFTREKSYNFRTQDEFWRIITKHADSRRPIWLFAHNIGYDLTLVGLPERLESGEFKIFDEATDTGTVDRLGQQYTKTKGFICTENPPVILSVIHRDKWKLICVDTFNYWVTSLARMGEMLGKPKIATPAITATDDDWFAYCLNDVVIVKDCVLGYVKWIQENDLGKFRFTAPSQAMAAFRHRWNRPNIKTHNNIALRTFERKAYYGGRLECFFIGQPTGVVYELDVSSLYPSVMRQQLYPSRLLDYCTAATHTTMRVPLLDSTYIATVRLKTTVGFPKKLPGLGTIYPTGEYWTTLAGPELELAIEMGIIRDVKDWAKYELRELFTGFVDFFWNYRTEQKKIGNTLNADLAKLLMNSLYGKFGQMTAAWQDRPDIPYSGKIGIWGDDTFADGGFPWFRNIGQCVQQFVSKQEHPHAFPAVSAYITSYARRWMHNLMLCCGHSNVYYIATDALFCNQEAYKRLEYGGLLSETEIGLLRVKHKAKSSRFEALHHYQIGEHKVSGSRKKSARANQDGSFTEIQFESFERVLMRKPDGSVHVKPINKVYSKEYKRGTVAVDGWVKPLVLFEE